MEAVFFKPDVSVDLVTDWPVRTALDRKPLLFPALQRLLREDIAISVLMFIYLGQHVAGLAVSSRNDRRRG
jgi:hypothetical protein